MPLYDVHRNDFVNQNYQVTIGNNMGSEGSHYLLSLNKVQAPFAYPLPFQQQPNCSYSQQPQMGFAQSFPSNEITYHGGFPHTFQLHNAVPQSQGQPSFNTALSPTSGPLTPPQGGPLIPYPVPRKAVQKATSKSKAKGKRVTRNAMQTAKGELLINKPKRQRGPNKRPPGTAFSNLLVRSFRLVPDKIVKTSANL